LTGISDFFNRFAGSHYQGTSLLKVTPGNVSQHLLRYLRTGSKHVKTKNPFIRKFGRSHFGQRNGDIIIQVTI
jgi:predicted ThiF/HesA family dinucleotide-utilizing enzyme